MRSFHSFWLFAVLLLSPFVILVAEHKEVAHTNGSVKDEGNGFVVFKLVQGTMDEAKGKLVTRDIDKLNFTVAIPNDCTVRDKKLYFSYGSECTAMIVRSSNSFTTYNISELLNVHAESDVDFFLNQTHVGAFGVDDVNRPVNDTQPLSCKVKTSPAYNPGRFLIDFSFRADVLLSCNVSIKFNASNYEIWVPTTTTIPPPAKSIQKASSNSLLYILGGIAAGLILLVIIVLLIVYCVMHCRKKRNAKDLDNIDKAPDVRVSRRKDLATTKKDKDKTKELKEVSCLSKTPKKSKDVSNTALKVSTGIPPTRPLSATTSVEPPSPTAEDGKPTAADFLFYGSLPKQVQEKMGIHEDIVQWSENRRRKAMEKELQVNQPSEVEVEMSQDTAPAKEPQSIPEAPFGKEQFEPMVQRKGSAEMQGTQDSDD